MPEYPVWNVGGVGHGWIIGLIAMTHVYISHFAIGGGLYMAVTEALAVKRNDQAMIGYLRSHSNFLLLLTTVLGAMGGIGIWFAVGLVNPASIQALIHNFMFFWAIEWVVFVVEIAIAFFYYYSWDKVSPQFHVKLAWLYFIISAFSLLVINGILTFMLTPGKWLETGNVWDGFFNPSYFPSVIVRFLIMCTIAGVFSIFTSSRVKDENLRTRLLHYSAKWLMPSFFLLPFFLYWYFTSLPADVAKLLETGIANIGAGNLSVLTRVLLLTMLLSVTIYVIALVGPFFNPKIFTFGFSVAILILGLIVTGATESIREMIRKPYTVYGYLYSNGTLKKASADSSNYGILKHYPWIAEKEITPANMKTVGQKIFLAQCQSCHTPTGYRSMKDLAKGWDREFIFRRLTTLPATGIMPPFMGDEQERRALADYIGDIVGAGPWPPPDSTPATTPAPAPTASIKN
ncbi:MAG TPA: cytochrome ubiquinol oxidase subunit I [bacterium]|nr:cytochrome ubiquinol oxidase subunit I [bacterium]HMY35108.1 cytochrome ubiquinol oxidase subunit I [bacterium]HMZ04105.1 cytochrome ubiquinol oxidase subunit I [bacterium]HNB08867.1 cytochrome ubiquinol oxidase subunit I [bacterium]HNB56897.1 cytochrome ubiquinol oxidase subunit I [bacterium]